MKIESKSDFTRPSIITIALITLLCLAAPNTQADNTNLLSSEDQKTENIESISAPAFPGGNELMMFADIPIVVSATRSEQPINWSSVPISVIDADDIHYSGATNISEILRYVPGMDVLKVSRTRYAVGVRGLHDYVSDRTLTLIDGRVADSPLFGGSEFYRQPFLVEDIERIEVVRGPGGAAWGANAFNGVINIITKKPDDCLGWFATTTWTEFCDSYSHMRWAEKKGKWQWMFSLGYEDTKRSGDAFDDPKFETQYAVLGSLMGIDSFTTRDFLRNWRFDAKAIASVSEETDITFGSGYSLIEGGSFEFSGIYPRDNSHQETSRNFVRIDHRTSLDEFSHLQWYGNFARSNIPAWLIYQTRENDIEGQHHFRCMDDHLITLGGNFRWIQIDTTSENEDLVCLDEPFNDYWAGAFIMDSWEINDRLTLEAQCRGDWYSETQTDWSARLSALYALDPQKQHVLRFSTAKAFRTPLTQLREMQTTRLIVAPPSPVFPDGLWAINLNTPDDLENEESISIESGYAGKLNQYTLLRTDFYYQHYEKLIGFLYLDDPFGLDRFFVESDNIGGADAWGTECELALEGKPGKLSLWYAYNDIHLTHGESQEIRASLPATHKVGLTGRLFLPGDFTLNTNYRFTSETLPAFSEPPRIPFDMTHHLDITLSKHILEGNGEIMVGVSDLLNQKHDPVYGVAQLVSHETTGQTFFARIQLKF